MNAIRRFIKAVPIWAFLLVLLVIFVSTVYFALNARMPKGGEILKVESGYYIFEKIRPGSPVDKAGIRPGDTLVSMNDMTIEEWQAGSNVPHVGDTVISGIRRSNSVVMMPVVVGSIVSISYGFYHSRYILTILLSISSLFILYKKSKERSAVLFFIYLQFAALVINAGNLFFQDPVIMAANVIFQITTCFLGPVLVHFHLLFPRPYKYFRQFRLLPGILYSTGTIVAVLYSAAYIYCLVIYGQIAPVFFIIEKIALWWTSVCFLLAIVIAVLQHRTLKETLFRNQVRMVIIGSFFGFVTPMALALFYEKIIALQLPNPNPVEISQMAGSLMMICLFLIAIFRYRIWSLEIVLKQALLYLGATLIIILTYLFLIFIVDLSTIRENNTTRFIMLSVSVIIFLIVRDRLQKLINRLFHRETYDSATVVSDFEEKLSGGYRIEDLGSRILAGLDKIFHFRSIILCLIEEELRYNPVFNLESGVDTNMGSFVISVEFERKLIRSKVFSPAELEQQFLIPGITDGELVVPMVKDNKPYGFFVCGPKKSEKSYSMQDIRVLSLIAKRVIALFQTAALYQKDLDRQLMLERERARISQDMHDDIGASLTRISLMSEMVKNREDVGDGARQWLGQISGTSRGLMEEMNQIIWALNPKNDTLEGLVAYIRRFASEYLEPTSINHTFIYPASMPVWALSVETRRNIYLVVREALHNVVKHSGAEHVDLKLKMEDYKFKISIRDDGKGFDLENLAFPGNGLLNMKKRMNDIGGEIMINSEQGSGTEIELIVSF